MNTDLHLTIDPTEVVCAFPDERCSAIFAEAVARQWSVEDALDWSRVSFDRLAKPLRDSMARVYADVLYAEEFGVNVVGRMVETAPEGWHREFAMVQKREESRHAAFFRRVLKKLGGSEEESSELSVLKRELARIHDYDELMLHGHIIETAARVIFVGNGVRTQRMMATGIHLPGTESVAALLRAVVNLVGRDESRHIAFGTYCLRNRLGGYDAAAKRALEQRAGISARLMYRAFARRSPDFKALACAPELVLERTWTALRQQLAVLDLDIGDVDAAHGGAL